MSQNPVHLLWNQARTQAIKEGRRPSQVLDEIRALAEAEGAVDPAPVVWVFVSEWRMDETEPWDIGAVFASLDAARRDLDTYAADLNQNDEEAEASVDFDASVDLLVSLEEGQEVGWFTEFGFVSGRITARTLNR